MKNKEYKCLFDPPIVIDDCEERQLIVRARVKKRVLELSLYKAPGEPFTRIFQEKDKYSVYQNGKWSKKLLENVLNSFFWQNTVCPETDKDIINGFVTKCCPDINVSIAPEFPLRNLMHLQDQIRHQALLDRLKPEMEAIDKDMKLFGKAPKGLPAFVKDVVFRDEYILYFNRKAGTAFCTKCGTQHWIEDIESPKQGKSITCPVCGAVVKCRARVPEYDKYKVKWTQCLQMRGDNILVRYFCNEIAIRSDRKAGVYTWEQQRTVIPLKGKARTYMFCDRYHGTEKSRWGLYKDPGFWDKSSYRYPNDMWVYPRGLRAPLKLAKYRYAGYERMADLVRKVPHRNFHFYEVEEFLADASRMQALEVLRKAGFESIADAAEKPYEFYSMGLKPETDPRKILGIDRTGMKRIRGFTGESGAKTALNLVREFAFLNDREFAELMNFPRIGLHWAEVKRLLLEKTVSVHKMTRYVNEHCPDEPGIYLDAIRMAQDLGYEKKDCYIYPKDTRQFHDRLLDEALEKEEGGLSKFLKEKTLRRRAEQTQKEKDKRQDSLIRKRYDAMKKLAFYGYTDGEYTVVIPSSRDAFVNESKALNHCVARCYADKFARGDDEIFLIRRVGKEKEPFFTLELKGTKFIQCRTVNNKTDEEYDRQYGTEVHAFCMAFLAQVVEGTRQLAMKQAQAASGK